MKTQEWTETIKLPSEAGVYKLTADAVRVIEGGTLLLKDRGSKKPHFYTVKNSEINNIGDPGAGNPANENADAGERTEFTGGYIFGGSNAGEQSRTKKAKACVQVEAGGDFSMEGGTILTGRVGGGVAVRIVRHL